MTEKRRAYKAKYRAEHKEEIRAYQAKWRAEHPEERRAYRANYYTEHPEERRAYGIKYYAEHKEERRAYRMGHREEERTRVNAYNRKRRLAVIEHYGGRCVCCGETTPEFLSLDHINNDGATHRLEIGGSTAIHGWLKREGYPEGIVQVLCFNCNLAKAFTEGGCPHARPI